MLEGKDLPASRRASARRLRTSISGGKMTIAFGCGEGVGGRCYRWSRRSGARVIVRSPVATVAREGGERDERLRSGRWPSVPRGAEKIATSSEFSLGSPAKGNFLSPTGGQQTTSPRRLGLRQNERTRMGDGPFAHAKKGCPRNFRLRRELTHGVAPAKEVGVIKRRSGLAG